MPAVLRPIHPGEVLLDDFMIPLGVSRVTLARETGLTPRQVGDLVKGRRAITAEIALRLSAFFRTTDRFWMNLQNHYDLESAKDRIGERLQREVKPLKRNAN